MSAAFTARITLYIIQPFAMGAAAAEKYWNSSKYLDHAQSVKMLADLPCHTQERVPWWKYSINLPLWLVAWFIDWPLWCSTFFCSRAASERCWNPASRKIVNAAGWPVLSQLQARSLLQFIWKVEKSITENLQRQTELSRKRSWPLFSKGGFCNR